MIDRLVIWGGTRDPHSHRHIHHAFLRNARKLGIDARIVDDAPESRTQLTPGTTVIAANVWSQHIAPAADGVRYVLHNFGPDEPLRQTLDPAMTLGLQVYTDDAFGEQWDVGRCFSRGAATLFQPWGADLLPEEFLEPAFNPESREVVFVGAIWSDRHETQGELGNVQAIRDLEDVCAARGLTFRHLTHVTDSENVAAVRAARLAPAVAGGWQVAHNYLPCRAFKASAYGALVITNVPLMANLFGCPDLAEVDALVDAALQLRKREYEAMVREQQRVCARYTYRQSLESISRAFEELAA